MTIRLVDKGWAREVADGVAEGAGAVRLISPFIKAGARAFLRQDGDMVNLQNQGLKYDPSLLWIDDADRQAKWYQQLKREWTASRREGRPFGNPVEPATLRWRS